MRFRLQIACCGHRSQELFSTEGVALIPLEQEVSELLRNNLVQNRAETTPVVKQSEGSKVQFGHLSQCLHMPDHVLQGRVLSERFAPVGTQDEERSRPL